MDQKKKIGLLSLAKKTFAVISASLSTLAANGAKPVDNIKTAESNSNSIEELILKKELKPQFMLRLNSNLEKSLLFMHTSHSSHSSHRSHSSHSSHYSSSSSYSPPASTRTVTPLYTPPAPRPTPSTVSRVKSTTRSGSIMSATSSKSSYTGTYTIPPSTLEILGYHYRDLFKGCEGMDVEYLQKLLKEMGYDTPTTGYFGKKTEKAVKEFQDQNELKPNGIVNEKTHSILKAKVDEL